MLIESLAWRVARICRSSALAGCCWPSKSHCSCFSVPCFCGLAAAWCSVSRLSTLQRAARQAAPVVGYSTYSFLLCVVMATIALYPLMLSLPRAVRRRVAWPSLPACGRLSP
jgi:hypothetical protein